MFDQLEQDDVKRNKSVVSKGTISQAGVYEQAGGRIGKGAFLFYYQCRSTVCSSAMMDFGIYLPSLKSDSFVRGNSCSQLVHTQSANYSDSEKEEVGTNSLFF
jgi:hypothetical protein